MSEKKDVLEFPLEKLEVPAAIIIMMQAAAKVGAQLEETTPEEEDGLMERLQQLCEKLEARVEDAIEAAKAPVEMPDDEDDTFTNLEGHEVSLRHERVPDMSSADETAMLDIVSQVVVDRAVYGLLCNERVTTTDEGASTACMKSFGHGSLEHEDKYGNLR